ncbi:MAG: hypothetical protein ACREQ5_12800, partial [Candidatus Dormibacteria bacterium]
VLPALLDEFAGAVDLIYIDPPFATGQDFSRSVTIDDEEFVKEPSMIEVKAYRDTWGRGLDSYLEWFSSMATVFLELLSDKGSLYIHLDSGVSHYAKRKCSGGLRRHPRVPLVETDEGVDGGDAILAGGGQVAS